MLSSRLGRQLPLPHHFHPHLRTRSPPPFDPPPRINPVDSTLYLRIRSPTHHPRPRLRSPGPHQPRPPPTPDPPAEPRAETPRESPETSYSPNALSPHSSPISLARVRGTTSEQERLWRTMASSSFRDSINNLGWSRRAADLPVNTAPQGGFLSSLQSYNPFGDRGYVQLPTHEGPGAPLPAPSRREEEEAWFACESTAGLPIPNAAFPILPCHPTLQPPARLPVWFCPPRVLDFPCRKTYNPGHVPVLHGGVSVSPTPLCYRSLYHHHFSPTLESLIFLVPFSIYLSAE